MKNYKPAITPIEQNQKLYTAEDFINERLVNRNFTQALCYEIEEFNKLQRRIAEMWGEDSYEYVIIEKHNPNIWEEYYVPIIGKSYIRNEKFY